MDRIEGFLLGMLVGALLFLVTSTIIGGGSLTKKEVCREAFELGYMEKVIDENDQVEYKWIQPTKEQ